MHRFPHLFPLAEEQRAFGTRLLILITRRLEFLDSYTWDPQVWEIEQKENLFMSYMEGKSKARWRNQLNEGLQREVFQNKTLHF